MVARGSGVANSPTLLAVSTGSGCKKKGGVAGGGSVVTTRRQQPA